MPPTLTTKSSKMPPLTPGEFRFITASLTSDTQADAPDARRRFRAVASSTITDLMGNTISLRALTQMRDDFRAGLPIFMDHDHENVVDKVFGQSDSAEIVQTADRDDRTGAPIYDLIVSGPVNEPNPKAVQLHESIIGGYVKFGASIGAIVREHKRDKGTGGMLINGISVKEASIVGIPKNQRSWVYKASLAAADLPDDPNLSDDDDETDEPAEEQVIASSGEMLQQWNVQNPTGFSATNGSATLATVGDAGPETIAILKTDDNVSDNLLRTETPADEPAAAEAVLEDETTPGGQEADVATPETAPATEDVTDPAIEQKADIEVEDVAALVAHVKGLVEEIGRLRLENERLSGEIVTVKASFDQLSSVEEDVTAAIRKVMELPLRRRAVGHVEDLVNRYPQFDPRVSAYIERTTQEKK
jgi:hypothetical protein